MESKTFYIVKLATLVFVLHSCRLNQSTASDQCSTGQQSTASEQCRTGQPLSPFYGVQIPNRGGLSPLLQSAHSTDNVVVGELPYDAIRNEISKVYNVTTLDRGQFTETWLHHSRNTLFLAGFVAFVGLLLPVVMVALWTFWECCYEEDEDEDEDNRNLTLTAQVFAWSLVLSLLVLLLCLFVFVCILLAGSEWITDGVRKGSEAMNSTLPELVRLRDESLSKVNRTLITDYNTLSQQIQNTTLDPVAPSVRAQVYNRFSSAVGILTANVSREVAQRGPLRHHAGNLRQNLSRLKNIEAIVEPVRESLMALTVGCSQIAGPNASLVSSDLQDQCEMLVSSDGIYVPSVHVNFSSLAAAGELMAARVVELLGDSVFQSTAASSESFEAFLQELVNNLTFHIDDKSSSHLNSFGQHLILFARNVTHFYNFSFSYPQSQEQLEEYLGPRQLENWDWFRSSLTVTFALSILLMMLCLLVAMARGLFNVFAIYCNGEDMAYIEGAHQAGTMVKKLAFGFCAVCIISALSFGYFISVAGVMGRACGPQNNFSEIVKRVIDEQRTWKGEYPLGRLILQNPSYPLTVQLVLDSCRRNESLFMALQLANRFNLEESITLDIAQMSAYILNMKSISQTIGGSSLLPLTTQSQLQLLRSASSLPVRWEDYTTLSTDSLFQEGFVGVAGLNSLLRAMEMASASMSGLETHANISSLVVRAEQTLGPLQNYTTFFESALPSISSSASYLQTTLAGTSNGQLLSQAAELESGIKVEAVTASHKELTCAAVQLNNALVNYTVSARHMLQCQTGLCISLPMKYDQFSSAVCGDVVPGMDVYWTSLILILVLSLLVVPLSLLLASRFIDLNEKANRSAKFDLASTIIRQLRATFWLILSISIDLWLVVHISRDDHFHSHYCRDAPSGCCASCVWGFGILFLLLAVAVGGVSRVYQGVVVYRIKKCKAMKVRRFWINQKKRAQFYGQLGQLILQDVSFLILAGTYANGTGILNVPAFFSILVSLVGIITYLVYLILERENISSYLLWLKGEVGKLWSKAANKGPAQTGRQAQPAQPQTHPRSPHGSSESEQSEDGSQGTAQNDPNFVYVSHQGAIGHRLSVIPEQAENTLDRVTAGDPVVMTTEMDPRAQDDMHTETELSQAQQTAMLDRAVDSENEAFQERRHFIDHMQGTMGVEIAAPYYHRPTDFETSTTRSDSVTFGSKDSISASERYYSSSQPPDDHYELSDYREDYDNESDYSQQSRYQHRLSGIVGEMSMDV